MKKFFIALDNDFQDRLFIEFLRLSDSREPANVCVIEAGDIDIATQIIALRLREFFKQELKEFSNV